MAPDMGPKLKKLKKLKKQGRGAPFKRYEVLMTTDFINTVDQYDPAIRHIYLEGLHSLLTDFCKETRNVDPDAIRFGALTQFAYRIFGGIMATIIGDNPAGLYAYKENLLKQMTVHIRPVFDKRKVSMLIDFNKFKDHRHMFYLFSTLTERDEITIH